MRAAGVAGLCADWLRLLSRAGACRELLPPLPLLLWSLRMRLPLLGRLLRLPLLLLLLSLLPLLVEAGDL